MADDLDLFGSWAELTDALKPKSLKGRKMLWWHVNKRSASERRNRRQAQKQARAEKAFVKRAVDGPRDRARPGATARMSEPGRWMELLRDMGDSDWTMTGLCALLDRDMPTTHATVKRRMMARGFVERRPNPNTEHYVITGGMAAGSPRPGKNRWLYRRTELGANVAAGLVEWRKPREYKRWKYRNLKLAKARAGVDGSTD